MSELAVVWKLVSFSLSVGVSEGVDFAPCARAVIRVTGGRPSAGLCPLPVGVVYRLAAGDSDTHTAGVCVRHGGGGVMMWM